MAMYGVGDRDDATERFEAGATERLEASAADVTSADRTVRFEARDDSAGFTVPGAQSSSTDVAPRPVALPHRIPAQFVPPAAEGSPGPDGRGHDAASIRIGNGVVSAVTPPSSGGARSASRRFWGRATRILSGLATVVLIGAAVWTAWQWWQHLRDKVQVASVAVAPAQVLDGECDVQYDIVGTITTNGKAGIVSYEWVRSDGQNSGTLKQSVGAGQTSTTVHLHWEFTGEGAMNATATLRVLAPTQTEGSAQIPYSCR
jgi:hypothetical protein